MLLKAAFHQDLHCFLRLKQSSGTKINHFIEVLTGNPLQYKLYHSILIVVVYMGLSIKTKGVETLHSWEEKLQDIFDVNLHTVYLICNSLP